MTIILHTLHLIAFLSCCLIAVALTEVKGHTRLGPFTIAYNETPQEYAELAMTVSKLGDMK